MPTVGVSSETLIEWGSKWLGEEGSSGTKAPNRFDKKQGMEFGHVFDDAFGSALAAMLGNIPVERPNANALTPPRPDCVEVGTTRVIGGIRPQNYDAAYRPDGPRVVFDSKTLNDQSSIRKNWQNMINDLASEAATVHTRFPYCIVVFIVVLPAPAVPDRQRRAIASTLERLGSRKDELDQHHLLKPLPWFSGTHTTARSRRWRIPTSTWTVCIGRCRLRTSTATSTFLHTRTDQGTMTSFKSNKVPPSARKLRGGYYTPTPLADYLCRWAIREPSDRVIEPSCGDGSFVRAATSRLGTEGAVTAVEVVPGELERAKRSLGR